MNTKKRVAQYKATQGFTLIELLVVIAIIGILASIVLPKIAQSLRKGQVTKAVGEISGIDTAVTSMLADVGRSNFNNWFIIDSDSFADLKSKRDLHDSYMTTGYFNPDPATVATQELTDFYTDMFYQLIRQGKNADIAGDLKPEIRQKLANSYMDLSLDPWNQQYQFWIGPMRGKLQVFRSYRIKDTYTGDLDQMTSLDQIYRYDETQQLAENARVPGSPKNDFEKSAAFSHNAPYDTFIYDPNEPHENAFYGYPAPKDHPLYVFSKGPNQLVNANALIEKKYAPDDFAFWGGGDDINNWDSTRGWDNAPK